MSSWRLKRRSAAVLLLLVVIALASWKSVIAAEGESSVPPEQAADTSQQSNQSEELAGPSSPDSSASSVTSGEGGQTSGQAPSPYDVQSSSQDNVDPSSGTLVLQQTDMALPGRNGMDLHVSRSYNSKSINGTPKWNSYTSKKDDIYLWDVAFHKDHFHDNNPISPDAWAGWAGGGWRFNIGGELFSMYSRYWHDSSGDTNCSRYVAIQLGNGMSVSFKGDSCTGPLEAEEIRYRNAMKLIPDPSGNGYILTDKTGMNYFFQSKTLEKKIRYADSAQYCQTVLFGRVCQDWDFSQDGIAEVFYLDRIVDPKGNAIKIEYETLAPEIKQNNSGGYLRIIPMRPKKIIDSVGRYLMLEYQRAARIEGEDASDSRIAAIHAFDVTGEAIGEYNYIYDANGQMIEVVPPLGNSFRFEYIQADPGYQTNKDDDYNDDGYLLSRMIYPTGGSVEFTYRWDQVNPDSDHDGMDDAWEIKQGMDSNDATGINGADGLFCTNKCYFTYDNSKTPPIQSLFNPEAQRPCCGGNNFGWGFHCPSCWRNGWDTDADGPLEKNIQYYKKSFEKSPTGTGLKPSYSSFLATARKVREATTGDEAVWSYQASIGQMFKRFDSPAGESFSYTRGSVTDPYNIVTSYEFDRGLQTKETGPLGDYRIVTWDFDRGLMLKSEVHKGSHVYTNINEYDTYSNLVKASDDGGTPDPSDDRIKHFQYNYNSTYLQKHLLSLVSHEWLENEAGEPTNEIYYEYDNNGLGNLIKKRSIFESGQIITSYGYDNTYPGNLISITDAMGRVTTIGYESQYHALPASRTVTLPSKSLTLTETKEYTPTGQLKRSLDYNGFAIEYHYDLLGRLVREVSIADGLEVEYQYDDANNRAVSIERSDQGVRSSTTQSDSLGRTIEVSQLHGATTYVKRSKYNKVGKISEARSPTESDPQALTDDRLVRYEYDELYRVKRVHSPNPDPSALPIEYIFDNEANSKTVIDQMGNSTIYYYNGFDLLVRVEKLSAPGKVIATNYEYDRVGNIIRATDPRGFTRTFTYDKLNRVIAETNQASGEHWQYQYDLAGNLIRKMSDVPSDTVLRGYDELNRPATVSYLNSSYNITYAYDDGPNAKGQLTYIKDSSGVTTLAYDLRGRIVKVNKTLAINPAITYSTEYAYHQNGDLKWIKNPGETYRSYYDYDDLGRVIRIRRDTAAGQITIAQFEPRIEGTTGSILYGNGIQTTFNFDRLNRPTTINTVNPNLGNKLIFEQDYTYDAASNRSAMLHLDDKLPSQNILYYYDDVYQLTRVSYFNDGAQFDYSYDLGGNRKSFVHPQGTILYNYAPDSDRILNYNEGGPGSIAFSYDHQGRIVSKGAYHNATLVDSTNYVYDPDGRLVQVELPFEGKNNLFAYDAAGNRVVKTTNEKTTIYLWGLTGQILAEADGWGNLKKSGVYAGREKIAEVEYDKEKGESLLYFHNDILGSPIKITDAAGEVVHSFFFGPFGEIEYEEGQTEAKGQYTGKEYDADVDLVYFGARYYDPTVGRFITPDPAGAKYESPQTFNPYVYCINNPLKYIDPKGEELFAAILAALKFIFDAFVVVGEIAMVAGATYAVIGALSNNQLMIDIGMQVFSAGSTLAMIGNIGNAAVEWAKSFFNKAPPGTITTDTAMKTPTIENPDIPNGSPPPEEPVKKVSSGNDNYGGPTQYKPKLGKDFHSPSRYVNPSPSTAVEFKIWNYTFKYDPKVNLANPASQAFVEYMPELATEATSTIATSIVFAPNPVASAISTGISALQIGETFIKIGVKYYRTVKGI